MSSTKKIRLLKVFLLSMLALPFLAYLALPLIVKIGKTQMRDKLSQSLNVSRTLQEEQHQVSDMLEDVTNKLLSKKPELPYFLFSVDHNHENLDAGVDYIYCQGNRDNSCLGIVNLLTFFKTKSLTHADKCPYIDNDAVLVARLETLRDLINEMEEIAHKLEVCYAKENEIMETIDWLDYLDRLWHPRNILEIFYWVEF